MHRGILMDGESINLKIDERLMMVLVSINRRCWEFAVSKRTAQGRLRPDRHLSATTDEVALGAE